ncbi:MAG: tetratricopeptide repeat protein [Nitrospina sp.]|nr:tetratricopeptide repeat protein [Nitrospina sp.]
MKQENDTSKRIAISLALIVGIFLAYGQVLGYGFLNFDDNRYVTENKHIAKGLTVESVKWAFTQTYISNWHPMTWLSHMLDIEWYGLNPFGHHLTGLLLHIANALLLFTVLLKMTGALWRSGMVAALFALHPLNVESVAWIAERKNGLSTFFWFLTVWAYANYVKNKNNRNYARVVLFMALGLMAKPMLVTLPFALLLLDFWPLNRLGDIKNKFLQTLKPLIWEKTPLFLLVIGSSVITYSAQKDWGAMRFTEFSPLYSRITNALVSYLEYLRHIAWPHRLSVFYPHPGDSLPAWKIGLSGLALLGITLWAMKTLRHAPYLAVGWFWYLGTLVPVIGIVQVGDQAMADRYMYIPAIGIFIAVTWGLPALLENIKQKYLPTLAGAVLVLLTALTWVQAGIWKNSIVLFEHAIAVVENKTPSFIIVYNNLGHALVKEKRYEEAIVQFQQGLKINPTYAKTYNNLGHAFNELKRYDESIEYFLQAIKIEANYAEAYNNLGNALKQTGRVKESIVYYSEAIRFKGDYAGAYFNLAGALGRQGQSEKAIEQYQKALQIKPDFTRAHNNLASLFGQQGDFTRAIKHYQQAIQIDPDFAKAHNNLGSTLAQQGRYEEAIVSFERAIEIDPQYSDARKNWQLARSLNHENAHAPVSQKIR